MNFHSISTAARVNRFGSGAVSLVARPGTYLSVEDIAAAAPTVFAEAPHSSRSERFVHIPTNQLLDGMSRAGFVPVSVRTGGSRDEGKLAFTKHALRFRRLEDIDRARTLNDTYPEAIISNAHDGTSAYRVSLGLFRLVCLNGMVVADANFGDIRVGHSGNAEKVIGKVIEGTYTVLDQGQRALEVADSWKAIDLNEGEQRAFARAALAARFGDEVPQELAARPEQAIRVRRQADAGSNLWLTFNRAQEALVKGGLNYTHTTATERGVRTTHRETRPVRSVDGDLKLNRALWTLATEMAALKAA
jgi:Domain of unknown function (DUF932)